MNRETEEAALTRLERAVLECRTHRLAWLVAGALVGACSLLTIIELTGRCG